MLYLYLWCYVTIWNLIMSLSSSYSKRTESAPRSPRPASSRPRSGFSRPRLGFSQRLDRQNFDRRTHIARSLIPQHRSWSRVSSWKLLSRPPPLPVTAAAAPKRKRWYLQALCFRSSEHSDLCRLFPDHYCAACRCHGLPAWLSVSATYFSKCRHVICILYSWPCFFAS